MVYDDGTVDNSIIQNQGPYVIKSKHSRIKSCFVSVVRYKHEHIYPPTLFISPIDNKKYILPTWIEVHDDTTIDDIDWVKPKLKKETVYVKGSMGTYKTTYDPNKKKYTCNCMGYFRSKGNCKHTKALKEKMLN